MKHTLHIHDPFNMSHVMKHCPRIAGSRNGTDCTRTRTSVVLNLQYGSTQARSGCHYTHVTLGPARSCGIRASGTTGAGHNTHNQLQHFRVLALGDLRVRHHLPSSATCSTTKEVLRLGFGFTARLHQRPKNTPKHPQTIRVLALGSQPKSPSTLVRYLFYDNKGFKVLRCWVSLGLPQTALMPKWLRVCVTTHRH